MIGALTGWLGLAVLVLAIASAIAADTLRQRLRPTEGVEDATDGGATAPRRRLPGLARLSRLGWVSGLTWLAVLLAVLGAVTTILRFVRLT